MFIDQADFVIKAGRGGDGAVSFRRERYVPKGGPDGGDGGDGGDVIFIGKHDMHTLSKFRARKIYSAENGANGTHKKMYGKDGADCIIEVPLGTIVHIKDSNETNESNWTNVTDIINDGQKYLAARGGNGGWGNAHFATSIKQAPAWAKQGQLGAEFLTHLELRLIADVGLVGLPNAGKSSLLSVISNARPKIANYPFTTLEPQLGVVTVDDNSFVVADIPGLIEGSSDGKGLGHQFLRHIDRTKMILYIIDACEPGPAHTLHILTNELAHFSSALTDKKSLLTFSKIDAIDTNTLAELRRQFPDAFFISAASGAGVKSLLRVLARSALSSIKSATVDKPQ